MAKIIRIKEEQVFSNSFGALFNDYVAGRTGKPGRYLRWQWVGEGVIVVPVFDNKVALRQMYRYSPNIMSLEFPAGGMRSDEDIKSASARELKEEFGLQGESFDELGYLFADTGFIQGGINAVLARVKNNHRTETELEEFEWLEGEIVWLSEAQFMSATAKHEIQAGLTIAAATLYFASQKEK
jgi:8-oxo-dGTP pyrophosphatase MutT (NUDIX family)